MSKRRAEFIIAGVLALCGCVMITVGAAMGGRPGSFINTDGQIVYQNSRESIFVSDTPFWLNGLENIGIFRSGLLGVNVPEETGGMASDSGSEDGDRHGQSGGHSGGLTSDFNGTEQTVKSGETLDIGGYDKFDIEVDYGYVTIESGDSPELHVEGYLSANVWEEDGVLKIESEYDGKDITKKVIGGVTHHYKKGEDITTKFTIILPEQIDELDVNLGAGAMEISSLSTVHFSADAEVGSIEISGVSSQTTELDVDMGSIRVTDHDAETVDLSCNLGAIKFSGNVTDFFEAECSLGSIEAAVSQPSSYGYIIDNNLGSIILDGKSFSVNSDSEHNDAGVMFDLKCDMGSIVVRFEDSRI